MAIFPKVGFHESTSAPAQPVDVDAWTEQATASISALSVSSPQSLRGTATSLAIPLDERPAPKIRSTGDQVLPNEAASESRPRREPLRRDSLNRREALLKGKEGSRQRRRWMNDRLLDNPWAQPPLPSDWEVHPTYPKHAVPYYLAPLWDAKVAAKAEDERRKREGIKARTTPEEHNASRVPKEIRGKLKKAKASKGLLQDLEEQIRKFVKSWEEKMKKVEHDELDFIDSEDEEIVFVGRNGQMHDMPSSPDNKRGGGDYPSMDQLQVFDSLATDRGASFGRWLVHNIATYYGLRTWSVTVGDPARREAYVGIKQEIPSGKSRMQMTTLPRPLWGMV